MTTIATAPTTVPIIRYQPLRSEAPRLRLADDRRGGPGPERVVELEPERDVEREADRSPKAQAEQERWSRRSDQAAQLLSTKE